VEAEALLAGQLLRTALRFVVEDRADLFEQVGAEVGVVVDFVDDVPATVREAVRELPAVRFPTEKAAYPSLALSPVG